MQPLSGSRHSLFGFLTDPASSCNSGRTLCSSGSFPHQAHVVQCLADLRMARASLEMHNDGLEIDRAFIKILVHAFCDETAPQEMRTLVFFS
jgi:hypothetical protein